MKRNVNGSVPAGTPTFDELFPKGSPAREAVLARMESVTGLDFMTVCSRFDAEMLTIKRVEAEAVAERRRAANNPSKV